jgi:hypothetical protein
MDLMHHCMHNADEEKLAVKQLRGCCSCSVTATAVSCEQAEALAFVHLHRYTASARLAACSSHPASTQGGYQSLNRDGTMDAKPTAEQGAAEMRRALLAEARRRLRPLERYPPATRKRRLVDWLQRGGHDWGTVRDVLEELEL